MDNRNLVRQRQPTKQSNSKQISNSNLVFFAFCSTFFPRIFTTWLGFPSIANVLHLGIVPLVFILILMTTRVNNFKQIAIVRSLLMALVLFLTINFASAILNEAGTINAILNFLILTESFFFLIALISIPLTSERLQKLQVYLIAASLFNIFFAFIQEYVLGMGDINPDYVQGVFYESGAGHVISASVSMTFGLYFLTTLKTNPLWLRIIVAMATFWQMNIADAKQVILVFFLSGGLLVFIKFNQIAKLIYYTLTLIVIGAVFFWAIHNIPALSAFLTWARPEIYGPDGEATKLKLALFQIVPNYFDSLLHLWLGLGPGHTVGRLGGWMLWNYREILEPLGSTVHPVSGEVWMAASQSWLGDQSSMFSPLFGWAGIWGDLGLLGLGTYIYIWSIVWRKLCFDDVSKFLVINVFVFGLVFTQMEEPGYMVYVAFIIGLRWQQYFIKTEYS